MHTMQVATAPARRVCVGCDLLATPVRPGAPLCQVCAEAPRQARERIERRLTTAVRITETAAQRYQTALAVLSKEDKDRWHRFGRARVEVQSGTADTATEKRVSVTLAALKRNDPRMGDALCAVYLADESLFWVGQEYAAHAKRAQEHIALLDAWIAQEELSS